MKGALINIKHICLRCATVKYTCLHTKNVINSSLKVKLFCEFSAKFG